MASLAAGKDAKKTDGATTISAEVKTSVLNEAKAMNNMDGKDSKGDKKITGDISLALNAFQEMIPAGKEGGIMYELRGLHLGKSVAKGKTKDDVHKAFLFWAQKTDLIPRISLFL